MIMYFKHVCHIIEKEILKMVNEVDLFFLNRNQGIKYYKIIIKVLLAWL